MSDRTDRRLFDKSLPDAVRIQLNKLNKRHSIETNQTVSDEIEAQIQAIEAQYYPKAKPKKRRAKKDA